MRNACLMAGLEPSADVSNRVDVSLVACGTPFFASASNDHSRTNHIYIFGVRLYFIKDQENCTVNAILTKFSAPDGCAP